MAAKPREGGARRIDEEHRAGSFVLVLTCEQVALRREQQRLRDGFGICGIMCMGLEKRANILGRNQSQLMALGADH